MIPDSYLREAWPRGKGDDQELEPLVRPGPEPELRRADQELERATRRALAAWKGEP